MSWYEHYIAKYGEEAAKELMRSRALKVKNRPGGYFKNPTNAKKAQLLSAKQRKNNNVLRTQNQ